MQYREIIKETGKLARRGAQNIGALFGKVNPDVWREFGYVSCLSYSLLLPKRETVVNREPDGCPPLVLVHGLGGNRGCWLPLRAFLRLHGRRRIYAFGYEDGTIEAHAAELKRFIIEVLEATGEPQVEIIAHSLGGIIARWAVQKSGLEGKVRTLITLASPNQGTYAAQYLNTPLTRPLRPASRLLNELNRDDLSRLGMRFVTFSSDRDIYVVPATLMTHPAADNFTIPNLSHSQFLLSPVVFRRVVGCLSPAVVTA